jgi:twinkle protein
MKDLLPTGEFLALEPRHLSAESCEKWGYHINTFKGSDVQVADYRDDQGQLVAQKVRFRNKEFTILGNAREIGLFGKHLWRERGKRIIITEGELDAISVSQIQDHKWPVVSVPNGAQGAKKALQADLQYLESFEEVILCFDNDEPGIAAARECALLFTPGKCKIATLPLKDANDMLVAGRVKELIDALWAAKTYRPDGIVAGVDLWDTVSKDPQADNYPTPWPELNAAIGGIRKSEIITLTAGSGIGKSQLCREIACDLVVNQKQTVGYIALEESTKRTALGLMGVYLDRPIHLGKEEIPEADLRRAFDATVGSGRVFLYDHFGSLDSDNLISRIRYLVRGCDCNWIILDHISIAVSGIEDGDERRIIDNLMTKLRSLVQETGVGMVLVSHLKRPEGTSHEEGGHTSLAQLRGSASIGQISDTVIGVERDQQDEDKKHISTLRVLKCRWNGQTGKAGELAYDPTTGRLKPNGLFTATVDGPKPKGIF